VDEGDLKALLREHAGRHSVPGAAIGVLRDGTITTACYGVADIATGEQVTSETRFSAGSLTKSMVATVIARLADEGRIALDDRVAAHVPEVSGSEWARGATLRDLLANRSGLPLREALEFGFDDHRDEDDGALARLASAVGACEPTPNVWSYTNVGWCLLGRATETVTSAPWEEAMRRHVLEPAGMDGTTFATSAKIEGRASGHEVTAHGPVPVEPLVSRAYGPAGTSAISTVVDLLRLAAVHIRDPSLAALREKHADVSIHGWFDAWCLGWASFHWSDGPVWGWDGLINGERSVLRLMPDRRAAVVVMTNSGTGRAMVRSLIPELMDSLFGIGVPPLRLETSVGAAGDLSRFAGVYGWPDRRVEVTATADRLAISEENRESDALPVDECTFLVDPADPDNPTVTFGAFDAAGRPGVLYVMLWGLPRLGDQGDRPIASL